LVLVVSTSFAQPALARLVPVATAFGEFIHHRYATATGRWACPDAQNGACLGEVRVGSRRHLISAVSKVGPRATTFVHVRDRSWVRRWSPYSKAVIRGFGAPGSASVNSPYFDWPLVAAGANDAWRRHRTTFDVRGFDGDSAGLGAFYDFGCAVHGTLIRCANALGDGIRYAPSGEPGG
jgi:hypothetical protein